MSSFSGFILRPTRASEFEFPSKKYQSSQLNSVERVRGSRWYRLEFRTEKALIFEHFEQEGSGPYTYNSVARWGGENLIVASTHQDVSTYFIANILPSFGGKFYTQQVHVDKLVRELVLNPRSYSISYLHARLGAFGSSLRSISMYGEDITSTPLVLDNLDLFSFYNCGISEADTGREIARLGNKGTVGFNAVNEDQFDGLDNFLRFLKIGDFYAK